MDYRDNARQIADFLDTYRRLSQSDSIVLSVINVTGMASPDGSYAANRRLADKRTTVVADYLKQALGLADSLIVCRSQGIDWDGLAAAIAALDTLPERDTMLDIIKNTPELSGRLEPRKQSLISLRGGENWRYLKANVFPYLRATGVLTSVTYYVLPREDEGINNVDSLDNPDILDSLDILDPLDSLDNLDNLEEVDTLDTLDTLAIPKVRIPVVAIRSNLLLPLLNVGIEVPIGNHWSVAADYYYPWQPRNNNHKNCFQTTFFSGEARYWFGKGRTDERRLLGHSMAAYGAWGYYDIEHNWRGHQGDFWSAGLDYLYALPICKGRLHLEFQFAVGYLHSKAQPYRVYSEGGYLIRRKGVYKNFNYFGPTKVGVSLVLPINKKGGRR